MNAMEKALVYLMHCAANDVKPDISKIESVNQDGLYEFALFHSLASPTAIMLKRAGIKNENSYAMRFSDEDFYVFLVAHEYKHLCYVGTGLRSLLDRYVFLSKKGKTLDRGYINAQMRELKTDKLEKESGELAFKLFSGEDIPPLTDNEQKMLEMYLRSGTFGTYENLVSKRLNAESGENFSKSKYIRKRLFPSRAYLAESVPFVKKSPLLYPVGYVWRIIKAAFSKRDRTSSELKTINNYDKDKR